MKKWVLTLPDGQSIARPKDMGGWGLKNIHLFGISLATKSLWNLITKESLWKRIIIQKYIAPGTLINWIRWDRKNIHNVSNQWKALTLDFLVVGTYLTWKVGNGSQVRVGADAIMGCGNGIFLLANIIQHLQEIDKCTLNLMGKFSADMTYDLS
jgi:hypothetical protein